jgi:hypothetical protein
LVTEIVFSFFLIELLLFGIIVKLKFITTSSLGNHLG